MTIPTDARRALRAGWRWAIAALVGIVIVILLSFWTANADAFLSHMIVITIIYATAATAWNIIGGFAGQLSLGHAGYFGIGAYTSSILYVDHGVSPWIGMLVGMVIAAVVAFLVGIPTFRLRGPYYAMATLALGIILLNLAIHFSDLTRGTVGLPIPFDPSLGNMTFIDTWPYVLIAGGYLLVCLAVSAGILRSRLGYQLAAVREDEDAARALGVDASRAKLIASALSGALTAGVGTIYAQFILYLTPESTLGIALSVQIIVFAVVGGSGSLFGPLIGAAILVPIGQVILRDFGGALPGLHTLVYGIVVIVVVLFARGGVSGLLEQLWAAIGRARSRRAQ